MAYYIVHHYCKHRKETIFSEKTKGILLYFNHVFFQMATFFKTGVYIIIYAYVQDLSHAVPFCQSHTAIEIIP